MPVDLATEQHKRALLACLSKNLLENVAHDSGNTMIQCTLVTHMRWQVDEPEDTIALSLLAHSRYIESEKRRFLAKSLHVEDQNEIVGISNLLFLWVVKILFKQMHSWMFSGIFVVRRKHVASKLSPVEMIFCEKLARIAHQKWSIISQKLLKSSLLMNNSCQFLTKYNFYGCHFWRDMISLRNKNPGKHPLCICTTHEKKTDWKL